MSAHSPLFTSAEDETRYKQLFAEALLKKPDKPLEAGQIVFGANMGLALYAAQSWVSDIAVLEYQAALLEDAGGEAAFLPSKSMCARSVWNKAHDTRTSVEEFTRLMELYAKLMAFLERPAQANPNGIGTINARNVLVVPIAANRDDWEAGAMAQQRALAELGEIDDAVLVVNA